MPEGDALHRAAQRLQVLTGQQVEVEPGRELGLNTYALPLDVQPGNTRTVTMELIGGLDLRNGYRLTAVPQPMVHSDTLLAQLDVPRGWSARRVEKGGTPSVAEGVVTFGADPYDEIQSVRVDFERRP